jgi:hypothetical protein
MLPLSIRHGRSPPHLSAVNVEKWPLSNRGFTPSRLLAGPQDLSCLAHELAAIQAVAGRPGRQALVVQVKNKKAQPPFG